MLQPNLFEIGSPVPEKILKGFNHKDSTDSVSCPTMEIPVRRSLSVDRSKATLLWWFYCVISWV